MAVIKQTDIGCLHRQRPDAQQAGGGRTMQSHNAGFTRSTPKEAGVSPRMYCGIG
ncbi:MULTISPECIES: hypothetical protein [Dickeya]|uniref:hypothetical protein n=1 Tax=Dickeya TaxID=204037 RepID=UPI000399ABFA|nr:MULTISPECIES: hypothetical protein [Dickeya]